MSLPVLYHDSDLIVVAKPSGLLVHRSDIDRHATEFAVQTVRDQIGKKVYPVHRLDRPTSGALLFALSAQAARHLADQFEGGQVQKNYLAVVRGVPSEREIRVDHALQEELDAKSDRLAKRNKPAQEAQTHFTRLASYEFPVRVDKYPTSIYSLVKARPVTGRKHQIRRHLRHLGHPIIGDVTHGSGKHNRFFREQLATHDLLLACTSLSFQHPTRANSVTVNAPLQGEFNLLVKRLGWEAYVD